MRGLAADLKWLIDSDRYPNIVPIIVMRFSCFLLGYCVSSDPSLNPSAL